MKEISLGLTFDDVLIQPKHSSIKSRKDVDLSTTIKSPLGPHSLEIPLLASPMDTVCEWEMAQAVYNIGGLGFIHRYMSVQEQVTQYRKVNDGKGGCGVAIGLTDFDHYNCSLRMNQLRKAGAQIFLLDVAYGDSDSVEKVVEYFKQIYDTATLIVGNVTSAAGFATLASAGADAIRVGIGGGSACSTRITTGVGVPQLTAILECAEISKSLGVTLIADGGIRNGADIAKALGAGADVVMCGNVLAGSDESPGDIMGDSDAPYSYKEYRGMASKQAQLSKQKKLGIESSEDNIYSEGVVGRVKCTGPVKDTVNELMKGVRSAFSYVGAHTLKEFHEKVEFIQMTRAGVIESNPHNLEIK